MTTEMMVAVLKMVVDVARKVAHGVEPVRVVRTVLGQRAVDVGVEQRVD